MHDPIALRLREIATPQLYQRNAFRLAGLPTDADRRTVRQRRQKAGVLLEVGAQAGDPDDVLAAFDLILGDPRRRLVEELFWLWGTVEPGCSCPASLHTEHDAAVRAHSDALEREAAAGAPDDLWEAASAGWGRQLRRAAFWDHVRHRIEVLDDKQLGQAAIDVLRDELPISLVRPLVTLAASPGRGDDRVARLSKHARSWPVPSAPLDDLLEHAATPLYDAIEAALREAAQKLRIASTPAGAAAELRTVLPQLRRLSDLVPPARYRRTGQLRNDVAVAFNNCAVHLIEDRGPKADADARPWLEFARDLANDPATQSQITQNTALLDQLVALFPSARPARPVVRTVPAARRPSPEQSYARPYRPQYENDDSTAGCFWTMFFVLIGLFMILYLVSKSGS